jgi:AcrR family transcriptional regulator
MSRTSDKRARLIEAAKTLLHRKGFQGTTLADIAKESGVPLGNVYYYFKTKEELCEAVIEERKKEVSRMLNMCCIKPNPRLALKKFVQHLMEEAEDIAESGCPIGELCVELDKSPTRLSASTSFIVPLIEWSNDQFRALGLPNHKDLAIDFIARVQGTMLLGHTLHDVKLIKRQLRQLVEWVDALQAPEPAAAGRVAAAR